MLHFRVLGVLGELLSYSAGIANVITWLGYDKNTTLENHRFIV